MRVGLGRRRKETERFEKSRGKRVKSPVDSIPKVRAWLPNGGLASGGGRKRGKIRFEGVFVSLLGKHLPPVDR
jgi:hypothetical protein